MPYAPGMRNPFPAAALLACGAFAAVAAHAQTMYRRGSIYQDRPCPADQKGRVVGSTGTAGC